MTARLLRPWLAGTLTMLACMAGAPATANETLTVLVEDAAGPWSGRDGTGMANDLVKAAFAAAGTDVKLDVVPYARCKALVIRGAAAACFSMSDAPEFERVVRFADQPLFRVYPRFYHRAGLPSAMRDESAIRKGMRMGIVNGYEYPASVLQLGRRGVVLEPARSDLVNLKKLASGRLDVALIMTDDLKTDAMLIRQAGVSGLAFGFQSQPMGSFIGFSTTHRQGLHAQRLFNKGYQRIARDGTKRRIEARWRRKCAQGCDG
jgi:polar amino acid transport system substrate-binding protein